MSSSTQIRCISCSSELPNDHTGIRCVQSHDICTDCCQPYIETLFENPMSSIPVKCALCQQEVPSLTVERQLNPVQLEIYQLYMIQSKLDPLEETRRCPHCQYFEI